MQGAERPVRLPGELERFKGLPMRVVFMEEVAAGPGSPVANKVAYKARPAVASWRRAWEPPPVASCSVSHAQDVCLLLDFSWCCITMYGQNAQSCSYTRFE